MCPVVDFENALSMEHARNNDASPDSSGGPTGVLNAWSLSRMRRWVPKHPTRE